MRNVFLDHQSGTPILPRVWEAMQPWFLESSGSSSSLHRFGVEAREALAQARARYAQFLGARSPGEIIFTSGGTEAANLAVKGVALANQHRGRHIVISAIEHPAVIRSAASLRKLGFEITTVPVDSEGRVDPESVRAVVRSETILICIHHVNHDVGTIEPIGALGELAHDRGIPFFVDATASAGWVPVDVQTLGATLLSLSSHRFHGPKGAGVLYRKAGVPLVPLIEGGDQEHGLRAGTENLAAIVGAGLAAEIALDEMPARIEHARLLQSRLWEGLKELPFLKLNGPVPGPERIATNLNVSLEFVEGEAIALALDMRGIAVASGASCVTQSMKIPPVLAALGVPAGLAQGNIILSTGQGNTVEEVDYFLETFTRILKKLRDMSPAWDEFQRGLVPSELGESPRSRSKD